MRIMVVDDEKLALSRMKRLLENSGIEELHFFSNPLLALEEVEKTKFDAVFLDISMPQISGLELASKIIEREPATFIVFQTAYEEYALEAFQSGGMGYLLKPVEQKAIDDMIQKIKIFSTKNKVLDKKIMGKSGSKIYLIDIKDIIYIKADLDEVIVRIKDAEVYVKRKIGDLELSLGNDNFFRIHRSYIINVEKIKSMQSVEQSKLEIKFEGIDEMVTSSKDGAKDFREYLEKRSL